MLLLSLSDTEGVVEITGLQQVVVVVVVAVVVVAVVAVVLVAVVAVVAVVDSRLLQH